MNENLAKYISSALRNAAIDQAIYESIESKLTAHHQSNDLHKPQFIVDARFSLRLEEVA
jgi:hypothetical protein